MGMIPFKIFTLQLAWCSALWVEGAWGSPKVMGGSVLLPSLGVAISFPQHPWVGFFVCFFSSGVFWYKTWVTSDEIFLHGQCSGKAWWGIAIATSLPPESPGCALFTEGTVKRSSPGVGTAPIVNVFILKPALFKLPVASLSPLGLDQYTHLVPHENVPAPPIQNPSPPQGSRDLLPKSVDTASITLHFIYVKCTNLLIASWG